MNLKDYQDYQFTENTEALVNDEVFEIKEWQKGNIRANGITVDNNGRNEFYLFHEIQLREKPSSLYVNVFKDGKVTIFNDYKYNVHKTPQENPLLYSFKAVECDDFGAFVENKGYTMSIDNDNVYIYKDKTELYESNKSIDICGNFNLQLLYEAQEEAEPELKEIDESHCIEDDITQMWLDELTTAVNQLIRRAK